MVSTVHTSVYDSEDSESELDSATGDVLVRDVTCPQAEFMARADLWRPGIAPSDFASGQDATRVQLLSYITKYMAKPQTDFMARATFPNRKQFN